MITCSFLVNWWGLAANEAKMNLYGTQVQQLEGVEIVDDYMFVVIDNGLLLVMQRNMTVYKICIDI